MVRYQEPMIKDLHKRAKVLKWLGIAKYPVSILAGIGAATLHWYSDDSIFLGFIWGFVLALVAFKVAKDQIEGCIYVE